MNKNPANVRENYTLINEKRGLCKQCKAHIKLKITLIILVILILLVVICAIFIDNNIGKIQNIFGAKIYQEEEEILPLLSYEIYDNRDENNLKVLAIINSEDGLEYVKKSDGTIIYCNGKSKLALDYICSAGIAEPIIIKENGKSEITENLTITEAGTQTWPLIIKTAKQLQDIQKDTDKLFKKDVPRNEIYYKIEADIDLTGIEWEPIGTEEKPFEGILDGNSDNYAISNLTYSNSEKTNVGLFGYVTGTLKNIKLDNCEVTGKDNVGAIVGYTSGSVSNCTSDAIVTGKENVGGLVGKINSNEPSLIFENNRLSGEITGTKNVGGLFGYLYCHGGSYINKSYSTANVSATGDNVGGVIGYYYTDSNSSEIRECYTTGKIETTGDNIGGFIGSLNIYSNVKIHDNFTLSDVSGNNCCGGLIGQSPTLGANVEIDKNYMWGNIQIKQRKAGSFVGFPNCVHDSVIIQKDNYYNPEILMLELCSQGEKREETKMFNQQEFLGWDFDDIWEIEEEQTMPYLKNLDKPDGVKKENAYKKERLIKELSTDGQSVTIKYISEKELASATINEENINIVQEDGKYVFSKVLTEVKEYKITITNVEGETKEIKYFLDDKLKIGNEISPFKVLEEAVQAGYELDDLGFAGRNLGGLEWFNNSLQNMGGGASSGTGGWRADIYWDYEKGWNAIVADEIEVEFSGYATKNSWYDRELEVVFNDGTKSTTKTYENGKMKISLENKKVSSIKIKQWGYNGAYGGSGSDITNIFLKNARFNP